MIEIFIENPNKKPVKVYQQYVAPPSIGITERAGKLGITVAEYHRRNKLIVDAAQMCSVSWGQFVRPKDDADFKKHGVCKVMGVVRHIEQYGQVEWAENPFILSVKPIDGSGDVINCTHNWVVKYEKEGAC